MAITRIPLGPDEDGDQHQQQQPVQPVQPQPIHPPHPLHQHSLSDASTVTVDIEAWTVAALESLSIAPIARGTGNALSIPLDARPGPDNGSAPTPDMKLRGVAFADDAYGASITPPRRPPSRRDSMRKRDALAKGKEGSRQRRRWENDHLLHVPNVQPPLPSDWQIHPTHRVLPPVPYQLAHYWDKSSSTRTRHASKSTTTTTTVGHVPRDLRNTAKRTPAVKSWLRVLEEPVRQFVLEQQATEENASNNGNSSSSDETDTDDEEIVFVGRNRNAAGGIGMRDGKPLSKSGSRWKRAQQTVGGKGENGQARVERGLVMDAMEEEEGGAFKRWLTHSISDYYGLDSKSVMVGTPARRVVYVGVKQQKTQAGLRHKPPSTCSVLPPPLWEMF